MRIWEILQVHKTQKTNLSASIYDTHNIPFGNPWCVRDALKFDHRYCCACAHERAQILNSLFLTIPKRRVQHLSAEWNNHWRWWINKLCNILIEKLFGYNQDLSCQYRSKTCQHKLSADSWYHRYYMHNMRLMHGYPLYYTGFLITTYVVGYCL